MIVVSSEAETRHVPVGLKATLFTRSGLKGEGVSVRKRAVPEVDGGV